MEANARTRLGRLGRSPFIFPLAVVMALALLILSEAAYRRALHDVDVLRQQVDARAEVQSVLLCVARAEPGEQDHLRTGRAAQPVHPPACEKDIDARLTRIAQAAGDVASWQSDVVRLRQALRDQQMSAVHRAAAEIMQWQTVAVQQARGDLLEVLWLHRVGIAAMVAVVLLAVAVVLRQMLALTRQREERRLAVQVERDQLEQQVRARTEELTELTRHLEWAAEESRDRLAATLHDELGALLTAAKLDAARLKARLGRADDEASERLAHLTSALNQVITVKRRLIEELRPSALQHLGLVPALEGLLKDVRLRSRLSVHASLVRVSLAPDVALTAYRLVQEALENVQRHADAQQVWVRLQPEGPDRARIDVRDDGRGFNLSEHRTAWHGLVGLRYRVQAAQGQWLLEAAPGLGTRVGAVLPLAGADAPGPGEGTPCQAAPTSSLVQH